MNKLLSIFLWFFITYPIQASASDTLVLPAANSAAEAYDLTDVAQVAEDINGNLTWEAIQAPGFAGNFQKLNQATVNPDAPVHWLRIQLRNQDPVARLCKISVTFTDYVQLYTVDSAGNYGQLASGDLIPVNRRPIVNGQMVFLPVVLPVASTQTIYLRLASVTGISQQFRGVALRTLKLYPEATYTQQFITPRTYQAMFYGALLIMLAYNFLIYLTLRNRSYLYYVLFTAALTVFLASNNGYIAETLFVEYPRLDLYVRFLSVPGLMISYLQFSRSYLQSKQYAPTLHRIILYLMAFLAVVILTMLGGYWSVGRSVSILSAVLGMGLIAGVAIRSLRRGFAPARYFLAANLLLLTGGIIYAFQHYHPAAQHPLTQYSLQLSAVLQVALFSIGLAARINLTQQELASKKLENAWLEKQKERELKNLIEQQNQELEVNVHKRTAEVVAQKEEIETQHENLQLYTMELKYAQSVIKEQNEELEAINSQLEGIVQERTRQLYVTNDELLKANQELDTFIYRTAHDIRGPLARLMGLSQVALMDVQDPVSIDYFSKLKFEANNLSYILSQLSSIHEISHALVKKEPVHLLPLIGQTLSEVSFLEGFSRVQFDIRVDEKFTLLSDVNLIRFILRNLLENAVRFQKKQEAQGLVIVVARQLDGKAQISVADNGIGISKEQLQTIFDMFSRAAGQHKTAGMGLYMTKLSVNKLGGTIQLADNPGQLTEFVVELPVEEQSVEQDAKGYESYSPSNG